jgi:hypothetical protein
MAGSVADDDVSIAVISRWQADDTLAAIPIARGRLTATVTDSPPYCQLTVEEGEKAEYSTGGVAMDRRAVTFRIWGVEADARAALAQVQAVFDPSPDGSNALTIPNAAFLVCWPMGRHVEEDPTTKEGSDVWVAVAKYEVRSMRSWPGN